MSGVAKNPMVAAAIDACVMLRSAERLLASCGCYEQAGHIRAQREHVEKCSVSSIEELRPSHDEHRPRRIAELVDEAANSSKEQA